MFTGIVETTGVILGTNDTAAGRRLRIGASFASDLDDGQSVSVSGVCLTVEAASSEWFEVFVAHETIQKTYLGTIGDGDSVNLERAMPASGRFDGHLVQGHVDTTTTLRDRQRIGDDWEYEFEQLSAGRDRYVVEKGSIALDGISLTVAEVNEDTFQVAVIPTTFDETTVRDLEPGDPVHVEVDIIAKYVDRLLDR